MIFIFTSIFLTGSLTFCNSSFVNVDDDDISTTHIAVITLIRNVYYSGLWVHELPPEIVAQRQNICQLLENPLVMPDPILTEYLVGSVNLDRWYNYNIFVTKCHDLPQIKENPNTSILFDENYIYAHLLRCDRDIGNNRNQTIYISKLLGYEGFIILANKPKGGLGDPGLQIIGFFVELINMDRIDIDTSDRTNEWTLFISIFNHFLYYEEVDEDNETYYSSSELNIDKLTVESRVALLKLCASAIRESSKEEIIRSLNYNALNVKYVNKDYARILHFPRNGNKVPRLILNTIECSYGQSSYYLIIHNSNMHNLFVNYVKDNNETVDLLYVLSKDTDLIEYAFTYIRNELL